MILFGVTSRCSHIASLFTRISSRNKSGRFAHYHRHRDGKRGLSLQREEINRLVECYLPVLGSGRKCQLLLSPGSDNVDACYIDSAVSGGIGVHPSVISLSLRDILRYVSPVAPWYLRDVLFHHKEEKTYLPPCGRRRDMSFLPFKI